MTIPTDELLRPIIGLANRTPLEVFDIMCDRIRRSLEPEAADRGVSEAEVDLSCERFWTHMKLIGCSKGFHEGVSETFAQQPEDDEKRELRDCIRAAIQSPALMRRQASERPNQAG